MSIIQTTNAWSEWHRNRERCSTIRSRGFKLRWRQVSDTNVAKQHEPWAALTRTRIGLRHCYKGNTLPAHTVTSRFTASELSGKAERTKEQAVFRPQRTQRKKRGPPAISMRLRQLSNAKHLILQLIPLNQLEKKCWNPPFVRQMSDKQ